MSKEVDERHDHCHGSRQGDVEDQLVPVAPFPQSFDCCGFEASCVACAVHGLEVHVGLRCLFQESNYVLFAPTKAHQGGAFKFLYFIQEGDVHEDRNSFIYSRAAWGVTRGRRHCGGAVEGQQSRGLHSTHMAMSASTVFRGKRTRVWFSPHCLWHDGIIGTFNSR
eukprot:scaffold7243_cov394-Prasinococcus_capsulatus_cf.AAC.15